MTTEEIKIEDSPAPKPKQRRVAMLGKRMVYVTDDSRGEWVLCLVPYAGTELIKPRDKFLCLVDHAKPHLRQGVHYPAHFHEQWVAERNLS